MSARVLDIEMSEDLLDRDVESYDAALVLLRWHGRPIGTVRVRCKGHRLHTADVYAAVKADRELSERLRNARLTDWLLPDQAESTTRTTWSIVVCTRDRVDDLRRCLDSLNRTALPGGEIVVVDNAPSDDRTAGLVAQYPVRYVREERAGLNWARSKGARSATGEIVIFTDDDVVVDPSWVEHILEPFSHPRVAAVTGLTLPVELETKAQELFEVYGGFGRGFCRRVFDYTRIAPAAAGMVGAGANMAIRRDLVTSMRLFDAELDCGTVARTGGDAYAFYQLLAEGYQIVYTPNALTWHRHRRDARSLQRTLAGYSVGGFAFLMRCWLDHGDWQAPAVALTWFCNDHLQQLGRALLRRPRALPFSLVWPQIAGCPIGIWAYFVSRRLERRCELATSEVIEAMGSNV